MRILLVSSFLPYPLFSGGQVRLYNLIRNLTENGHEITLICEKRNNQTTEDLGQVRKITKKVVTVDRRNQWTISNILRAGISLNSFLSVGHSLPEMKKIIENELSMEKYDLIHVETFYVNQNLPKVSIPVVLVEHNIEYLVYKRFADKAGAIIRPLIMLDVLKIKREEQKFWKQATRLVAVSKADASLMKRQDVFIVPNGVDKDKFNLKRNIKKLEEEKLILFIGDFKWIQNQDAAIFILEEIWPKILEASKENKMDLKLWIVGRKIPENIRSHKIDGVIFDENAPAKTEEIYNKADLLLAPIRIGGGTSYKIIESMASGLPVITTALGNEGIDAKKEQEIVLGENASELASEAITLLSDQKYYSRISEDGRQYITSKFDWEKITKKLEEVYKSTVK